MAHHHDLDDRYASWLKDLAKADVVAFGGVGFVGEILPVTKAYHALAHEVDEHGKTLRPHIERLLTDATPAGRVYAATLLNRLDPAAGQAAWRRLSRDHAKVRTFIGCVMSQTTVADYASDHPE